MDLRDTNRVPFPVVMCRVRSWIGRIGHPPGDAVRARSLASFRTSMYRWTHPLVVLAVAAVAGAMASQQFFQGSESVQRAPDTERNSTANLVFWSVSSLLQQWPNTRYANGMLTFQPRPTVQCADMR